MTGSGDRAVAQRRMLVAVILFCAIAGCGGSTGTASPPPGPASRSATLDVSWVSRSYGWLVAAEACGRSQCVTLYQTRDGGRDWSRIAAPHLPVVQSAGIRLVNQNTGYLFSGRLFMTTDGGRHWLRQPMPNVSDVLLVGDGVLVLTYDHSGCPGPCDVRVERADVGGSSWSTVMPSVPLGGYTLLAGSAGGVVAVEPGNRARAAEGGLAISTDAGRHWDQRGDPCGGRKHREYDLVDAIAVGATVTVLCGSPVGPDHYFVITSTNGGRDFGRRAWLPGGMLGHLASVGGNQLLVASAGIAGEGHTTYRIVSSTNLGSSWRQVLAATEPVYDQPDEVAGISKLMPSSAAILTYIADGVHAWRSQDAGRTWQPLPLPGRPQ